MKSLILVAAIALSGCVVYPLGYETQYEPEVYVGIYPLGYYNGFGYWDGVRFDYNFYAFGHPGYGHYYRGAPRGAYRGYHHSHR
jgi:hypothetical protein